jgi:hypothetical protein
VLADLGRSDSIAPLQAQIQQISPAPQNSGIPPAQARKQVETLHLLGNVPFTSVAFVRSDGFLVRMFGERDATFFIESLLKMNARDVYLVGNVPGWPDALMVQRPSVSDTPYDAVANNHPLWLLDFIPLPIYHVVPQKIWTPPNQSDWRRYVEQTNLRMPVFFIQNNGIIGLPLARAAVGDTTSLRDADGAAPLGGGHSTSIRIAVSYFPFPPHILLSLPVSDIKHRRIAVAWIRIVGAPDTDQGSNATSQ